MAEDRLHAEVRERALRLLARREHSEYELACKLVQRGYESALTKAVIAELAAQGLVSDERFAVEFIRSRSGQGFGPLRIRGDLARRGIEDTLVDPHWPDESHWLEMACAIHRKRFGVRAPEELREKAKRSRYLANRGFTGEQVRRVLENPVGETNPPNSSDG